MKRPLTVCCVVWFLVVAFAGVASGAGTGGAETGGAGPRGDGAGATGLVVEEAEASFAAQSAGLLPGDVLLRWQREASPPANPHSGELTSPFDLHDAELEQAPRGTVTLSGARGGEALEVRLPPGEWRLQTRPWFAERDLEAYVEGRDTIATDDIASGLAMWRDLANRLSRRGETHRAIWMWLEIASAAGGGDDWDTADNALDIAERLSRSQGEDSARVAVADRKGELFTDRRQLDEAAASYQAALELRQETSQSLAAAKTLDDLGDLARRQRDWAKAAGFYQQALAIREDQAPQSAVVATSLGKIAMMAGPRGDLDTAERLYRRALVIREKLLPNSLVLATTYNNLGIVARNRGDLVAAEELYQRGLEIREDLAPRGRDTAGSLNNLGILARLRGDLVAAEDYYRRALALFENLDPESHLVAGSLSNLGLVTSSRGDLEAAEEYYQRALTLLERLDPESFGIAKVLNNLGNVAWSRGDLIAAEGYHRRALAIREKVAPDGIDIVASLNNLGGVVFERGNFAASEAFLRRALAIHGKQAPRSVEIADALQRLGDIASARSEPEVAADFYDRALAIRRDRAPGSTAEAESCHTLASLHRDRGDLAAARTFYKCAVASLEAQRSKLGGSDEVRSGFGARYADIYREAIDLQVEVGNLDDAFHLLERYRARELLDLLAQRDLEFASDLPPALEERRQAANRNYDRAYGQWMRLSDNTEAEKREKLGEALAKARRQQDEIRAEIRVAAPRLSALRDPQPLDLDATRAALDPGTLLLSYSVGKERSHLFAVAASTARGEKGLHVFSLPIGAAALRSDVESFRKAIARGQIDPRPAKAVLQARKLSDALLAPAADLIARAERLLILADGPLHSIPFGALIDPGSEAAGDRYLAAARPLSFAASATVYALLEDERRERRPTRLTALGDPLYPPTTQAGQSLAPRLRAALRGLDLEPLPATRDEVEGLRSIYPQSSTILLGSQATEERAKAVGPETTHLHIAAHGLLDDQFPLDSALALTLPSTWQAGKDNGLLQAWEIFEQLRLDADLVTLSACDTGLGKVLGGEGLFGLTRAFQYAGARSVLATLWSVSDQSTGQLMQRFYSYLEAGESKAEALRKAQLDLMHSSDFDHPFHWAAFQLIGDWR